MKTPRVDSRERGGQSSCIEGLHTLQIQGPKLHPREVLIWGWQGNQGPVEGTWIGQTPRRAKNPTPYFGMRQTAQFQVWEKLHYILPKMGAGGGCGSLPLAVSAVERPA